MSSVETGISAARHAQKSRARSSRASARTTGARKTVSNEAYSRRRIFIFRVAPVSWRGLSGAKRIVERLVVAQRFSLDAPAVVVTAKSDSGTVAHSAVVQGAAHFVHGHPVPEKFHVGK